MNTSLRTKPWILGLVILPAITVGVASSASGNLTFEGRTISISVGGGPGMAFDLVARTTARHLPKYVPGKPRVLVQNQPWPTIAHLNYIANVAKRDGTALAAPGRAYSLPQLRGEPGVAFDARKLIPLGSPASTLYSAITIRSDLPYNKLEDLRNAKEPIYLGSTGEGGTAFEFVSAIVALLGLPTVKGVTGYRGFGEVIAAAERGELHGFPLGLEGANARRLISPWPEGRKGPVKVLLYAGGRNAALDAARVPHLADLDLPPLAKGVFEVLASTFEAAYPVVLPPGVPAGQVEILRNAYAEMNNDPEFQAEMARMGYYPNFVAGERVAEIHKGVLDQPAEVIQKLKSITRR